MWETEFLFNVYICVQVRKNEIPRLQNSNTFRYSSTKNLGVLDHPR